MKRILRNGLSFLLVMVLLLSMFSATAVGFNDWITTIGRSGDETELISVDPESRKKRVLYTWTADDLDVDREVFSSNLSDESDLRQRWNESAVMYTQQEVKQVKLHNFLNKVGTDANGAYGLNPGENLKVDLKLDHQESTTGLKAVALSFVYAHKANENTLNPVNSGLLQVYASGDGQNWSEDYVGVRSAYILGIGTGENDENIIYYQITTENLMSIDGLESVDEIAMLRIMPDGESGMCGGTFALCELTVTGYMTEKRFTTDVPAYIGGAVSLDEDTVRESLVETAKNSDKTTSLGKIQDALKLVSDQVPESERDFWNAPGIAVADGIDTKAKDTVRELLSQLLEREGEYAWDTITVTDEAGNKTTETVWQEFGLTSEEAEQILADYETIETTGHIVKDLNTPQQIFRAYANAKPGDLLLRFTQTEAEVYMITGSKVEFLPDGVNVKFAEEDASGNWNTNCSTMTYLGATGESTISFVDLFEQEFVPLTVSNLLTWNLDAYASAVDGVKVAIISDRVVDKCEITVGETTVIVDDLGMVAPICSDPELDAAVAELGEGTHQMTVTVTNDLGTTKTIEVEFVVEEEETVAEVQFELNGLNLRLQDLIKLGFYFNVETQVQLEQIGALLWTAEEFAAETDFTVNSAKAYKAEADEAGGSRYMVETEGIYAQYLDTEYYIIPYAVTADGLYVYGEARSSSALVYAQIAYTGGTVTENTRSIVIDLLNYADRARTYFGYTEGLESPETPLNAVLSEEDKVLAWNDGLKAAYPTVAEMTGIYNPTIVGLNTNLNEAIKLNFIFSEIEEGGGIGYWTEEEYNAQNEHNRETMPHLATLFTSAAGNTVGSVEGLYSYDIYSNFFVMAFDAQDNCSRAYGASVASYLTTTIENHAANPDASEEDLAMVELAKSMLIYGDNARNNPDVNKGSN